MADPAPVPVPVDVVLQTIRAALSHVPEQRDPAEAALRTWEADSAAGFLSSLLRIVEQHAAIDEATRLMAVVVAKNVVGSSWRKTLGTREWSRVPAEEKAAVRQAVIQLLLTDPSDRVGLQLSLLASNICAFDFPGSWPDILQHLLAAAHWNSPHAPQLKLRALRALKFIFKGLTTKRFVAEPPRPGQAMTSLESMTSITQRLQEERLLYKVKLTEAVGPLQQLLAAHLTPFLAASENWQMHGLFTKASVNGITELLYLIPSQEALPDNSRALLEALHGAFVTLVSGMPTGGAAPAGVDLPAWQELGGRVHERVSKAIISHLDNFAIPFSEFVPYFLQLFVDSALISLDASRLRAMRSKRRVLLVRFLAKALLCPYYRSEWLEVNQTRAPVAAARVMVAHDALTALLGREQVKPLVEAVVAKYVALSRDELEEWQEDPEGYIRSMDVESGPDADTPRPVGVGLLLCMLERGGESVAQALLQLATELQAQGEVNPEAVFLREACYRCIGEGYSHVAPYITFASWYGSELAPLLRTRLPHFLSGNADIVASVLQARALWLVGTCGTELPEAEWSDALGLAVAHMGCTDLVVALTAVHAVLLLSVQLLDDQSLVEQATMARSAAEKAAKDVSSGILKGGTAAIDALLAGQDAGIDEEATAAAEQRVQWRLTALTSGLPDLLRNAFNLLGRLGEVESSVRLLQLISVVAEAAGDQLQPHLGALAQALPQVWEAAAAQRNQQAAVAAAAARGEARAPKPPSSADAGSLARLHSALMAVLTHLVGKLRGVALENPQVQPVLFPLLGYATDPRNPEGEVLVEEAFRLWAMTMSACPAIPQPLLQLLPNMATLLRRGKDNTAAFQILEGYLLLGAGAALQPYGEVMAKAVAAAVRAVSDAVVTSFQGGGGVPNGGAGGPGSGEMMMSAGSGGREAGPAGAGGRGPAGGRGGPGGAVAGALATEVTQEGLAAAGLVDVMLQMYPSDVPALMIDSFRGMGALVASEALPSAHLPSKVLNIMEGFLEVLARLFLAVPAAFQGLLSDQGAPGQARFLDRWLATCSAQFWEELLGVRQMAMLGRFRRRIGAAAICGLLAASAVPLSLILEHPERLARLASLLVKVVLEAGDFTTDVARLDTMDFVEDLGQDYVLARRLEVAKGDAVRHIAVEEVFRTALNQLAAAAGGEAALLTIAAAANMSPHMQQHVKDLMAGALMQKQQHQQQHVLQQIPE